MSFVPSFFLGENRNSMNEDHILVRKDMNVNERDRLSNFTLKIKTQIKVKEQPFYYCCTFFHSRLNFTDLNKRRVKKNIV